MLVESNKSIPDNVRKKTLRWFKKELGMTSEGLLHRLGGNHLSYWSNYLGGTRPFAKYDGYMKMAEAYGITEDQFIRKMEEFIREDLSPDDDAMRIATHMKSLHLSPEDVIKAMDIYQAYKN